jgi:hypothetical protein
MLLNNKSPMFSLSAIEYCRKMSFALSYQLPASESNTTMSFLQASSLAEIKGMSTKVDAVTKEGVSNYKAADQTILLLTIQVDELMIEVDLTGSS